jgi:hypothetical protein
VYVKLHGMGGVGVDRYWFQVCEARTLDGWTTVHLLDNAHGAHDEHRYVGNHKLPAQLFAHGDIQTVVPQAIALLKADWRVIMDRWTHST